MCFLALGNPCQLNRSMQHHLINSATVADYGEFNARVESLERATCNDPSRRFEKPMVVKDSVGAKVRTIRVIHYLR